MILGITRTEVISAIPPLALYNSDTVLSGSINPKMKYNIAQTVVIVDSNSKPFLIIYLSHRIAAIIKQRRPLICAMLAFITNCGTTNPKLQPPITKK